MTPPVAARTSLRSRPTRRVVKRAGATVPAVMCYSWAAVNLAAVQRAEIIARSAQERTACCWECRLAVLFRYIKQAGAAVASATLAATEVFQAAAHLAHCMTFRAAPGMECRSQLHREEPVKNDPQVERDSMDRPGQQHHE